MLKALPDGSFISRLLPGKELARRSSTTLAAAVRVIDYTLSSTNGEHTRYRLLTSLLEPAQAPALELAATYHERWEVESVFDELKTHLHQGRRVLRSKTPDLVRQEFYGWVLAHYAVRRLMHAAGSRQDVEPRQLSFVANVQHLKQQQLQSGAFPPSAAQHCTSAGLSRYW